MENTTIFSYFNIFIVSLICRAELDKSRSARIGTVPFREKTGLSAWRTQKYSRNGTLPLHFGVGNGIIILLNKVGGVFPRKGTAMGRYVKVMRYLVWLTQLGLSVAAPLVCFILLGVWLRDSPKFGIWNLSLFCI